MPPVSEKQRRLMRAVANDPAVAKKTGVSRTIAKEFNAADKGGKLPDIKPRSGRRNYAKGGAVEGYDSSPEDDALLEELRAATADLREDSEAEGLGAAYDWPATIIRVRRGK